MKPLYLRTCDAEGDLRHTRMYLCEHPRKNETDLRQDYNMAFDLATNTDPEEWTMIEVMDHMVFLGWKIEEIEFVSVTY